MFLSAYTLELFKHFQLISLHLAHSPAKEGVLSVSGRRLLPHLASFPAGLKGRGAGLRDLLLGFQRERGVWGWASGLGWAGIEPRSGIPIESGDESKQKWLGDASFTDLPISTIEGRGLCPPLHLALLAVSI